MEPPRQAPSARSPFPTVSDVSVEIITERIQHTDLGSAPNTNPSIPSSDNLLLEKARTIRAPTAYRTARRQANFRQRLEARLGAEKLAARDEKRLRSRQLKAAGHRFLEEACMKRELKRAKRAKIAPGTFQTIDNSLTGANGDPDLGVFAGEIIVQDHLSAMAQAVLEHTREGPRRKEPGRHSYHVDAAVSHKEKLTDIAIVHKTHRQDWASPWTINGYRIHGALRQSEAELWAIRQVLDIVLEKVRTDRENMKMSDPCSLAVIYTDSLSALHMIQSVSTSHKLVARSVVTQSVELERLGVKVQLHWVPGHSGVPGNELADLVCQKARQSTQ
ncbi:MAG: hypothetical protein Q9170_002680 [Blastenia crenularia]